MPNQVAFEYPEFPEQGLKEEGPLDILAPFKQKALDYAQKSGLPGAVATGIDFLTPDGIDLTSIAALLTDPIRRSLPKLRFPKILKKDIPDESLVKIIPASPETDRFVKDNKAFDTAYKINEKEGYKNSLSKEIRNLPDGKSHSSPIKFDEMKAENSLGIPPIEDVSRPYVFTDKLKREELLRAEHNKAKGFDQNRLNKSIQSTIDHEGLHALNSNVSAQYTNSPFQVGFIQDLLGELIAEKIDPASPQGKRIMDSYLKSMNYWKDQYDLENMSWWQNVLTDKNVRDGFLTHQALQDPKIRTMLKKEIPDALILDPKARIYKHRGYRTPDTINILNDLADRKPIVSDFFDNMQNTLSAQKKRYIESVQEMNLWDKKQLADEINKLPPQRRVHKLKGN
jgi:hypothetical protein